MAETTELTPSRTSSQEMLLERSLALEPVKKNMLEKYVRKKLEKLG